MAKSFNTNKQENEVSLYLIDCDGRRVTIFLKFRKVTSPFGFLQLVLAEKEGTEVAKNNLKLQKIVCCTNGHNFVILFQLLNPMTIFPRTKLPK